MTTQVYNPLNFSCAPNEATPDYVICDDLRKFVAFGLMLCWISDDPNDPNAHCGFPRPFTTDDVRELRSYFLDLVETLIVALWKGQHDPGEGYIDGNWQTLIIRSEENESEDDGTFSWQPRLDPDAIMLELVSSDTDYAIWLNYDAITDRQKVLEVLMEARRTIAWNETDMGEVWPQLVELAETPA